MQGFFIKKKKRRFVLHFKAFYQKKNAVLKRLFFLLWCLFIGIKVLPGLHLVLLVA